MGSPGSSNPGSPLPNPTGTRVQKFRNPKDRWEPAEQPSPWNRSANCRVQGVLRGYCSSSPRWAWTPGFQLPNRDISEPSFPLLLASIDTGALGCEAAGTGLQALPFKRASLTGPLGKNGGKLFSPPTLLGVTKLSLRIPRVTETGWMLLKVIYWCLILTSYIYNISFNSVLKLKHKMCLGTALSCKLRHSLGNASRILTVAGNHKNTWMNTGQSLQKYILFTEQTLSNEIKLYSSLSTSKKDCIQKKSHSYRCRVHKESVLSPVRSLMRSKWSLGRSAQFSHTHTAKKKKSHVCLPTELLVLWSYPFLSSWFLIFAETLHETNIPLHILVRRGNGFKSVLFFPFLCNVWLKK